MDTLIQTVYIVWYLIVAAAALTLVGKTPTGSRRTRQAQAGFIHALCTVAFVIWWETPDSATLVAQYATIALLWVPWLIDLTEVNKPWKPITVGEVIRGEVIIIARIVLVLGFWVL